MRLGWYPFPIELVLSTAFQGLALVEQGALRSLYDTTAGRPLVRHHDGYDNTERARRLWGEKGPELLDALFRSGLLEDVDEDLWRLTITVQLRDEVDAPEERPSTAESGGAPIEAKRALRALWSKAKLADAESRLAWLRTPRGTAALTRLGVTASEAEGMARGAGQRGGRFGLDRDARRGVVTPSATETTGCPNRDNHGDNGCLGTETTTETTSPSLSHSPSGEKEKEKQEDKHTPKRANTETTPETTNGDNRCLREGQPRRQPGDNLTVFDLDDVLPRESNGRVEIKTQAQQKLALLRLLNELEVDRPTLVAMAVECREPAKVWPHHKVFEGSSRAKVTVPHLLGTPAAGGGYEAKNLQDLVGRARARIEAETPAAPRRPPTTPTKRPEAPFVTPEQAASIFGPRKPTPVPADAPLEPPHAPR